MERARGGRVVTVSGAHGFLVTRNVIPFAHIDCDPRGYKTEQMGAPHADVRYWIASCVDPSFIDRLDKYDVSLFHMWSGDESAPILDEIEPGSWCLAGGSSVGLRAISLLYSLGYRTFDIHGMDCSFEDVTHAGPHLGKRQEVMDVWIDGRWFETSPQLVAYARQFFDLIKQYQATFRLHGDGMLQHMAKTSQKETVNHG